jgi:formylglycine-generating enzyme required for sulfatase activity
VLLEFLEGMGAAGDTDSPAPSEVAEPADAGPLSLLDGGRVLALSSGPIASNALEIQLMDADSAEQGSADMWPLTDNSSDDISPAWSPDGQRVAFLSESDASFDIYVLDVEAALQGTGEPRRLTKTPADEYDPSWSPDGTQIAFSSGRGGGWGIYVMDVPGGGEADGGQAMPAPRKLTGEAGRLATLDWSPDGTHIVFESSRDGNRELYLMAVPGEGDAAAGDGEPPTLLRLTDNDVTDFAPDWSPDGMQIAYASLHGGNYDIYIMEADGSNPRRLTTGQADDWWPDWSPDGEQIVFSSFDHSRSQERYYHEVFVMRANGRGLRRLTTSTADDWYAAWRPEAATEAFPPAEASLRDAWTRPADNMAMVYVPGGTFEMGSAASQVEAALRLCEEYPDTWGKCELERFQVEAPQHTVTLDGFWLDRTEVTNTQYGLCVEAGACRPSRLSGDSAYDQAETPVAGIPWQDAAAYCAWAGGRLPTEAEWEYAARGSEGRIYPWGDEFDCAGGNFGDEITGCDDGYAGSAPVGSFPAGSSWCGVLDLAGNAWEWVADAYGAYSGEDQTNPTGPADGDERILRGGSWAYYPPFLRTAHRYPVPPTADYLAVGFRCAVEN